MITFEASFNSKYPSMYFASFLRSAVSINYSKSVTESVGARTCSIRRDEIILMPIFKTIRG